MIIQPFKMEVTPEQGSVILNFLHENGIKPIDNCSNPYGFILYRSNNEYITLNDWWRFEKYSENLNITYNDFVSTYIRVSKIKKLKQCQLKQSIVLK